MKDSVRVQSFWELKSGRWALAEYVFRSPELQAQLKEKAKFDRLVTEHPWLLPAHARPVDDDDPGPEAA